MPDQRDSSDRYPIRDAHESDSSDLALFADAATRRLVSWTWDHSANPGQSSFEVGRNSIRSDVDSLSHYGQWRVAEVDGKCAGGLNSYRMEPATNDPPPELAGVLRPVGELKARAVGTWYVSVASVFPEFRGLGVGGALLDESQRLGAAAGASALTLVVASFNEGAHRLYQRHGFREDHRLRFEPFRGSDAEGDWILMVKEIA